MGKIIVLIGFLVSTSAFASDDHIRGAHHTLHFLNLRPSLVAGTYNQNIDHFGQLSGQTFNQRYWVDSQYATNPQTAPVIYHICGEGDATQDYFLHDNAIEWAKVLGAHLVYLEHRYYGASLPFSDLSNEHLLYLTLDNALEDLATFQKWISDARGWTGKWISVGGSYSGTLSALYRQKHPELVVGALAASAPMISGTGQLQGTDDDVKNFSSIDPSSDTGDRQWIYQSCRDFGFWQTDGFNVYEPSPWLCTQLFGNSPRVNASDYNQKYDAPFISNASNAPSNILFTYGTADIWTTIGLSVQINQNSKITIHMINGGGHHFDLNAPTDSDSNDVKDARQVFLNLAADWLKK